jgi:D-serine deaminase-like pyridoxal phosphate-dependent protein
VASDLGFGRLAGLSAEEAARLAHLVMKSPSLEYAGIAFYPGHVRSSVHEQGTALAELSGRVAASIATLSALGAAPGTVSGGSTPTAYRTHEIEGVTEFRPGTYVFNDRTTAEIGACAWEDCALTVLARVVSTAVAGQAVIDAGTKALGREPLRTATSGVDPGYGVLLENRAVTVKSMSEEHGILDLSRTDWRPVVGDIVRVIPNHVCIVVHLNEELYGLRDDRVIARWDIEARGRRASSARSSS